MQTKSRNPLMQRARVKKTGLFTWVATSVLLAGSLGACATDTTATAPMNKAASVFVTLGTNGGPVAEIDHAQPANILQIGDDLYLVDAGDGAAGQLFKAGYSLKKVQGLFLSHLHFDHTGGVLAVLGLRMQTNARNTLTIYGPPGTEGFIDGLLKSMGPIMKAAYGMPGQEWAANVKVVELVDDSVVELKGLTVTAAENSHFAIPQSSGTPEKAKSLSFRFDMSDRSIAFTGDTGPSRNVEELAKGADLLVSEMMDIPAVLDRVRRQSPYLPEKALANIEWHFRAHHITPEQVGELAAAANVGAVVITHIAPIVKTEEQAQKILKAVGSAFDGRVTLANDLDRF
ncbi:MAG: MBL fold metallo-hydrolase [Gammaproteobacteria bacterium]